MCTHLFAVYHFLVYFTELSCMMFCIIRERDKLEIISNLLKIKLQGIALFVAILLNAPKDTGFSLMYIKYEHV